MQCLIYYQSPRLTSAWKNKTIGLKVFFTYLFQIFSSTKIYAMSQS